VNAIKKNLDVEPFAQPERERPVAIRAPTFLKKILVVSILNKKSGQTGRLFCIVASSTARHRESDMSATPPKAEEKHLTRHVIMHNHDLVSDGFLTLTAASLVLLGSSLLALAEQPGNELGSMTTPLAL
jgi:hypothetical protein